jgi:hypothetical protein
VTPKPAQVEIAIWLTGHHAPAIGAASWLPVLARQPGALEQSALVQPGLATITGSLKPDRENVTAWAAAGVTHLLLELPAEADLASVMTMVSRHVAPEVGMPHFPRVMSESRVPLPWPGARGGRDVD